MKSLKAIVCCALLSALMLTAVGCAGSSDGEVSPDDTVVSSAVVSTTEELVSSEEKETPPEESDPAEETDLYYVKMQEDRPIYSEPNYGSETISTTAKGETYTIVEEVYDDGGNVWGKLAYDAGWIDVTSMEKDYTDTAMLTVKAVDENFLQYAFYAYFGQEDAEGLVPICFQPHQRLTDFSFTELTYSEDGAYEIGEELDVRPELNTDMPFVAEVSFPGDMTAYGFSFKDAEGAEHQYAVTISGEDGSLVYSEF